MSVRGLAEKTFSHTRFSRSDKSSAPPPCSALGLTISFSFPYFPFFDFSLFSICAEVIRAGCTVVEVKHLALHFSSLALSAGFGWFEQPP